MSHFAYVGVGLASLLLAVFISSQVARPLYSQTLPNSNLVKKTVPPASAATPSGAEPVPPAAPQAVSPTPTPTPDAASVPPPPPLPAMPVDASAPPLPGAAAPATPGAVGISENVSFLEPYVFDLREGRRNPFRVPVMVEGSGLDMVLPGTPLERYDLEELKLAGIMWDVKAPKAMIVDPQGEVHVLGKDDRIGRKRGYIAVIREGEVVVVETTTFNGENTYSTRILRIDK